MLTLKADSKIFLTLRYEHIQPQQLTTISTLAFLAIRTVQNATNGELQHQHIILQRDSERINDHDI